MAEFGDVVLACVCDNDILLSLCWYQRLFPTWSVIGTTLVVIDAFRRWISVGYCCWMGQYFLLLRTTCEGEIVFVLMGLLLPGVSISCRCLRHVRVRLFCIPGVAFTRFLFRVADHLCTCIVFLWGFLFPVGIVIPVEGGKRWVSSCAGWKRFFFLLYFVS